jgi:hypothetical protein
MKAFKYCEYKRCKNYKKRNLTLCHVHERKTESTYVNILELLFFISISMFISMYMFMYLYVEDFNVYVNTTILDYKQLAKTGEYQIIDSLVNNVLQVYY